MERTEENDYVVFILSHGRADNVVTYKTLRRQGYTGHVVVVIDDEDKQRDKYIENFGRENVAIFNKASVAQAFDEVWKGDRRTVVYARNACFDIARQLGYRYFIELDDDYIYFCFTFDGEGRYCRHLFNNNLRNLDAVFSYVLEFYRKTPFASVAMSQRGDFVGGAFSRNAQTIGTRRKAMNVFFMDTERPFFFIGRINEDVNTYTASQRAGLPFLSFAQLSMNQTDTQSAKGGMTDVYNDSGTYIKSFFSVIVCPSAVKVSMLGGGNGARHMRIHHQVTWKYCAPKIIREEHKKVEKGK